MKILTQSLLLAASLLPVTTIAADTPGFDVLKAMSVSDFRATGLDKLSDTQIKALDTWFAEYQKQYACAQAPAVADSPVTASTPLAEDAYPLSARLVGKFTGWNGGTTFTLDNGEVWQQTDDSSFTTGAVMNPKVTISRGLMHAFYLSVEGVKDTVLVRRIKP